MMFGHIDLPLYVTVTFRMAAKADLGSLEMVRNFLVDFVT